MWMMNSSWKDIVSTEADNELKVRIEEVKKREILKKM